MNRPALCLLALLAAPILAQEPAQREWVISGRVTLDQDTPATGVPVRLFTSPRRPPVEGWGRGLPTLNGLHSRYGFEARTDATGSFRLRTPTVEGVEVYLRVEGEGFRTAPELRLATSEFGVGRCLRVGANDVGTLDLAPAGAITGQLVDEHGAPLAGELVRFACEAPARYANAFTGADGSFRLEHLEPARWTGDVRAVGRLAVATAAVDVTAGEVAVVPAIVAPRAPSIRGRVLAPSGEPVAGLGLVAYPDEGGWMAEAETDEAGAFVLALLEDRPHTIRYDLASLRAWGGDVRSAEERDRNHEPGSHGIELLFQPPPRVPWTVTVLDALTGDPVLVYDLRPQQVTVYYRYPEELELRPHPAGRAVVELDPEHDWITVTAPGYAPRTWPAKPDSQGGSHQRYELDPECVVEGVVLAPDGSPARFADVRATQRYFVDRVVRCDAAGRFTIAGLGLGGCSLEAASAAGTASLALQLEAGEHLAGVSMPLAPR